MALEFREDGICVLDAASCDPDALEDDVFALQRAGGCRPLLVDLTGAAPDDGYISLLADCLVDARAVISALAIAGVGTYDGSRINRVLRRRDFPPALPLHMGASRAEAAAWLLARCGGKA